ncbi:endoribonuclease MazF [Xenorhabdus ishibashii]|uniref:Toxin n=1 Tax=Xenorhabdus ishibashii TaxID=1034471 RepID=A0A2D0KHA2_9GAMM|nr:endoribonuclease MazF [Xenorhabdus ishibashii]PHM62803.1 toxin [Xenorhabdus ishibashii]
MEKKYIPDAGDIVWIDFDPQAGHEQAGRRPALVLSPAIYNEKTSLLLCCPMTTKVKGYPFEVIIDNDDMPKSAVLSDQVKSIDWKERNAVYKGRAPIAALSLARAKLKVLIG